MAQIDENYAEKLVNVVAKKIVETFENLTIEDVNMYQIGYSKGIEEAMKVVKTAYHNFGGYDLAFMQKYGNTTASQQHESYSTLMMYEIANEFDNLIDNLEQMKEGGE